MKAKDKLLSASNNPLAAIQHLTREGQDPMLRNYRIGHEEVLNNMFKLNPSDQFLSEKIEYTRLMMLSLADKLRSEDWLYAMTPKQGEFARTILALEEPVFESAPPRYIPGTELVVAHWGDGHQSPVHGHADGYIYEDIIFGQMLVHTYKIIDYQKRVVIPAGSDIHYPGTFASKFFSNGIIERQHLVHNFKAIGAAATLHYLPEHTRNGDSNRFDVQYIDSIYPTREGDVTRINAQQALHSKIGDVILVRSTNVPFYGDHYIIITGRPVMKRHGMRPQDIAIPVGADGVTHKLLDENPPLMGVSLLKLSDEAAERFLSYHYMMLRSNKIESINP